MGTYVHYKKGDAIGDSLIVYNVLAGGMGQVYLCLDKDDDPIAIKTFQSRFSTDIDIHQKFKDELRIWISLESHPNIVHCIGFDIFDGQPFILMEWVVGEEGRGTSLRDWLKTGPLSIRQSMDFAIDICRGLAHAQSKVPGIVHCDLKPDNVLISRGGIAKITDFGLASEGQMRMDASGTPIYMAPEQWTLQRLDSRTDIYAIGCILFELLTGTPPFKANTQDELRSQHQSAPIPLITGDLQVPQSLQVLIARCLAKQLPNRYQNIQDLLSDLENIYTQLFNNSPKPLLENKNLNAFELVMKANTYLSVQRVDQAREALDRAIRDVEDFSLAYIIRSELLLDEGKFDLALLDADKAIAIDPSFAMAYASRAALFITLSEYEHCAEDIQTAFTLDPHNPLAYIARSQLNFILYKYPEALSDIQDASRYMSPNHWLIEMVRAQVYAGLQKFELAQKDLQDFIAQSQYIPQTYKLNAFAISAAMHETLGQYDLALDEINQAIEIMALPRLFVLRADILRSVRKLDNAMSDINYALTSHPKLPNAYIVRGLIYIALMKSEKALDDLSAALKLLPDFWLAYQYRAAAFLQLQQPDQALLELANVRRLVENLPPTNLVEFQIYTGQAYVLKGEFESGKKHLNLAVALASELTPALKAMAFSCRGIANLDMGLLENAFQDLNQALEYDNNQPQTYLGLGILYIQLDDQQNAGRLFEKAAQLGMTIPYVYQLMTISNGDQIFMSIFDKLSTIDTFWKFEALYRQEPILQDRLFAIMLRNLFNQMAKDANLSEIPEELQQVLDWMALLHSR